MCSSDLYNPSAWGGKAYYVNNIDKLVALFTNANKTSTPHYDIPASMISALKANIEKGLG